MNKKFNKLYTISNILIFIVAMIAVLSLIFISNINEIEWTIKITALTSVLSATGGIISAILITSNFIHTKYVSIEAQRPSLIIQVINNFIIDKGLTFNDVQIMYRNITNYPFNNLKINVSIRCGDKDILLKKVFPNKIILLGQDSRSYRFIIAKELEKEGVNILDLMQRGDIILKISYDYEFNNEIVENNNIQNYIYINHAWTLL